MQRVGVEDQLYTGEKMREKGEEKKRIEEKQNAACECASESDSIGVQLVTAVAEMHGA